jgi:putative membrane protein
MRHGKTFWREALALSGSATLKVYPDVLFFGGVAAVICVLAWFVEQWFQVRLELAVAPFEIVGAALGLLLILRTNAGNDRWWEARKLWGGIVNQSRNLAISGMAYGPSDRAWREEFVRWSATFAHVARSSLRFQGIGQEVTNLLGREWSQRVNDATHMPSFVALRLASLLNTACTEHGLDRMAFLQIDKERAQLIDHIGACERILKTPLAQAYSIKIRRFLLIFLLTLPFVLLHRMPSSWMIPPICMLLAYLVLALDCIGDELQNPFSEQNLSHLPLGDISKTIEGNLLGLPNEISMIDGSAVALASTNGTVNAFPKNAPYHDEKQTGRTGQSLTSAKAG